MLVVGTYPTLPPSFSPLITNISTFIFWDEHSTLIIKSLNDDSPLPPAPLRALSVKIDFTVCNADTPTNVALYPRFVGRWRARSTSIDKGCKRCSDRWIAASSNRLVERLLRDEGKKKRRRKKKEEKGGNSGLYHYWRVGY